MISLFSAYLRRELAFWWWRRRYQSVPTRLLRRGGPETTGDTERSPHLGRLSQAHGANKY